MLDSRFGIEEATEPPATTASAIIQLFRRRRAVEYWPLLLAPVVLGGVFVVRSFHLTHLLNKVILEQMAVVLTSLAAVGFGLRYREQRRTVDLLLTLLAIAFTCREIHFAGSGVGIYVALVVLIALGVRWREALIEELSFDRRLPWVLGAAWAYFLSQFVARRALRGILPLEEELHIPIEETLETAAHVMLLLVAVMPSSPKSAVKKPGRRSWEVVHGVGNEANASR